MDNELFELCKAVSEKFPEWNDTEHEYSRLAKDGNGLIYARAFTSDYILEKLPDAIRHPEHEFKGRLELKKINNWYVASYRNEVWVRGYMANEYRSDETLYTWKDAYSGDTPLIALLKLTLALHAAGELK